MNAQLSPKEWQLLSEYLDGQLTAREQERLEQKLHSRPDMQSALEEMRRVRSALRTTPRRRVPRNFTLTHAMVAEHARKPWERWIPALGVTAALATVMLVVTLWIGALPAGWPGSGKTAQAPAQPEVMALEQTAGDEAEGHNPIILWEGRNYNSEPTGLMDGRGGGGGGGGGGAAPAGTFADNALEAQPASKAAPPMEPMSTPAAGALGAEQPAAPEPGEAPTQPEALAQAAPAELEGSGPILGVAPTEEQGKIVTATPAPAAGKYGLQRPSGLLPALQIALAALAVAAGLAAILLKARSRS